jgi:hypothetical protein
VSGGTLIVREGSSRLRWAEQDDGWQLIGLWPGPRERRQLIDQLAAGRPLLVVLDRDRSAVPVWRSELAPAWSFPDLAQPADPNLEDREMLEITVPFLDWLPAQLRTRGIGFAEHAQELMKRTPPALLAPLIVEERPLPDDHVRFVHRTGNRPLTADDLSRVASCLLDTPARVS